MCTPLPLSAWDGGEGGGGVEPPTKFSEMSNLTCRIAVFREGLLGRGGGFFVGKKKFTAGEFFTPWRGPEKEWFWQFEPFSKQKRAFSE